MVTAVLSEPEMRTLRAVADALLPAGGAFPLGAREVETAERVASFLEALPHGTQRQVRLLLRAWETMPLASRHATRFSALSDTARSAWLERCQASRLPWRRGSLVLLKTLCLSAFCSARRGGGAVRAFPPPFRARPG